MTWDAAAKIAFLAMGREFIKGTGGRGNRGRWTWRADDDPLAWWCLTELIMERARQ